MKQVTIRKVSDRGVLKAKQLAKERESSLNEVLVEALETGLGVRGQQALNGLEVFAADSDFGPEWEQYLTHDLNRIDEEIWN
jgi:hypothetical protein